MFATASAEDLPHIAALVNRAYCGSATSAGWSNGERYLCGERTTAALLREDLAASPGAALLKWEEPSGSTMQGCVWLEPVGGAVWYLGLLAIDAERQNSGLGRTMLASAEQWVRERDGRCIRMTVIHIRAALIAWYLRRGYHATGETIPFPRGEARFGVPLRDDLSVVVLEKQL